MTFGPSTLGRLLVSLQSLPASRLGLSSDPSFLLVLVGVSLRGFWRIWIKTDAGPKEKQQQRALSFFLGFSSFYNKKHWNVETQFNTKWAPLSTKSPARVQFRRQTDSTEYCPSTAQRSDGPAHRSYTHAASSSAGTEKNTTSLTPVDHSLSSRDPRAEHVKYHKIIYQYFVSA